MGSHPSSAREAVMQTENVAARRRFRLLDAIFLIAATAVAILPAKELLPEVIPIIRKLDIMSIRDYPYHEPLFRVHMSSSRMDSIRIQFAKIVEPMTGLLKPRSRYIDRKTGQQVSHETALANWVWTHARPAGVGFALAQDGYFLVFPFLIVWSTCLMVLRLLQPRPSWQALFRQPGWWACSGSVLGVVLAFGVEFVLLFPAPSVIVPATILVAWLVLGVTRKWKAEPSWIDRAGRLLGVLWLATIPIYVTGFVWK
jgi:hypothetical protein